MKAQVTPPAEREMAGDWCETYSNVVSFGAWLAVELQGCDEDTLRLQQYYEKPWKWTAERAVLMAERAAGREPDLETVERLAKEGR